MSLKNGDGMTMKLIAGIDEAGRGPLAGPVMAAAVILNPKKRIKGLDDSKKLTSKQREALYLQIIEKALTYGIAQADVAEIDQYNIHQATMLAMQRAFALLTVTPTLAFVDGKCTPKLPVIAEGIVRGDQRIHAISAASILAKVTRDQWMTLANLQYPGYGFAEHKGYGTAQHLKALQELGTTPIHRKSFAPVKQIIEACTPKKLINEELDLLADP